MNFDSPKSDPKKSIEKIDIMKVEKTEIASKPTQKPIDKPRNKIESPKIDIKKEPRNKIQREKVNLLTPTRNKIERPKIDFKRESRNKIQREKINLLTPSRNKIERPKFDPTAPTRNKIEPRKIDPKKEPKHKIQPRVINPKAPPRHKIEPRKIDIQKEPRHKIQRQKSNHLTPPRNKIEHRRIDIQKEPKHKIQHQSLNHPTPSRNKIEPRRIDIQKEPKHKIQRQKLNPLTPSRNKIERPTFDPGCEPINKIEPRQFTPKKSKNKIEPVHLDFTREPKNKISLPKLESKDMQNFHTDIDIDNTPSIQNIKNDILKLEKIKEEIKNVDWKNISDNWSITTRSNQYAEYRKVPLDPTKEVSKENPLYRYKEWLDKVYNDKNWKLNDKKIANLCGVNPSVIGKWRKKHQISRKLQGEGWIDKRSGRVYIRVPQDYDHPELTKRAYRLEHIYNIEKYLSRLPELELSKKYLVDGKYLKVGTRVKYINQDSKDNSVENLRINTNIVKPVEKEENLRSEKSLNKTILNIKNVKYPIKSSQNNSKTKQVEKDINRGMEPGQISKKIHRKGYRARITMLKDYNHPELAPNPDNRYIRLAHIAKMERFLAKNPVLELSKKYLIQGKYLKRGLEIHHINQIGNDNRIENLWIYESNKEHARGELTLYDTLKTLVGTKQIVFKDGKYAINQDFKSIKSHQQQIEKPINYKDINLVKEEIKKIDWNSISNKWSVQVKKNQFVQKTIKVDPTRDCSENNPLHHHKEWVKRIVNDKRFNLTDSRLAELCGFTRDTARYWRERVHGIKGKTEWG